MLKILNGCLFHILIIRILNLFPYICLPFLIQEKQMKHCAFLSMDSLDGFECYDHLLIKPLHKLGWEVETISWRNGQVDWNRFDAVIIRSTWDYQQDYQAFLDVLRQIDRSSARLENNLRLVEWNIDKKYLRDLQQKGVEIVPTLWHEAYEKNDLEGFFDELKSDQIIIKPRISAGAEDTFWITREHVMGFHNPLSQAFKDRPFMVQPFMPRIVSEGEFSVFFFREDYSHTILKTPKTDDFRVQEEHGGLLKKVEPEEKLLATARQVWETIQPAPLYTRADFVRTQDETFALMELELIEPSLYFNLDPESPMRFAKAFAELLLEERTKNHRETIGQCEK